jgi:hypothetical protein
MLVVVLLAHEMVSMNRPADCSAAGVVGEVDGCEVDWVGPSWQNMTFELWNIQWWLLVLNGDMKCSK